MEVVIWGVLVLVLLPLATDTRPKSQPTPLPAALPTTLPAALPTALPTAANATNAEEGAPLSLHPLSSQRPQPTGGAAPPPCFSLFVCRAKPDAEEGEAAGEL
jgi:hypothetical protein